MGFKLQHDTHLRAFRWRQRRPVSTRRRRIRDTLTSALLFFFENSRRSSFGGIHNRKCRREYQRANGRGDGGGRDQITALKTVTVGRDAALVAEARLPHASIPSLPQSLPFPPAYYPPPLSAQIVWILFSKSQHVSEAQARCRSGTGCWGTTETTQASLRL